MVEAIIWKMYLLDNKSVTQISEELNITKNKLRKEYKLK